MMRARHARAAGIALVAAVAATQVGAVALHALRGEPGVTGGAVAAVPALLRAPTPAPRNVAAYGGMGAWVDLYDLADGTVTPAAVATMARSGVRTLYLQAARDDGAGRPELTAPDLQARFLVAAHREGLRVVGWYVPRFGDVDRDLAHLRAIAGFGALGHRFDGVAVDIEVTDTVTDDAERSARLVELSRGLRSSAGSDAVGAIVMPPVQLEVVNPAFWPGFPWRDIAPLYDVWLPMGYWTERTVASGYRDPSRYTAENLTRLRSDVGADAPVHMIGGLGEGTGVAEVDAFVGALRVGGGHVIGASLYDWATLAPDARDRLAGAFGG
jgi:hypothetical protein